VLQQANTKAGWTGKAGNQKQSLCTKTSPSTLKLQHKKPVITAEKARN